MTRIVAIDKLVVIADVDGTLRLNKQDLPKEIEKVLKRFRKAGGRLIFITGAPLFHVPKRLFHRVGRTFLAEAIYAEMGGVEWREEKISVLDKAAEIEKLRSLLGIKVLDGLQETEEGWVIVEGPRMASLALLFESPPHYPSCHADANFWEVKRKIEELINSHRLLSLHLTPGESINYKWLDITATTKAETVQRILNHSSSRVFYLGDGESDLPPMLLPGVIAVGFENSIPKIREHAKRRGILIPFPAPEGGVVSFFSRLLEGEFSHLLEGKE